MNKPRKNRTRHLCFETLESRKLLSVTADFSRRALIVSSDDSADTINFSQIDKTIYVAGLTDSWSAIKVRKIIVDLNGGNDTVSLDSWANGGNTALAENITINGGSGNKVVRLADGHDVTFSGIGSELEVSKKGVTALDGNSLNFSNDIQVSYRKRVLTITGTNGNDTINLAQNDGWVGIIGSVYWYKAKKVKSVVVNLQDGNDSVSLDSLSNGGNEVFGEAVTINSGFGNKTVRFASGNNVNFSGYGHQLTVATDGSVTLDGAVVDFNDPEPNPEPDPEPNPEPDPEPNPEPDPEPNPEPDPEPNPEPDPEPNPEAPLTLEERLSDNPTGDYLSVFSFYSPGDDNSVYNSNLWNGGGVSLPWEYIIWDDNANTLGNGVAITPRHIICSEHGTETLTTLRWIRKDGTRFEAKAIDSIRYVGDTDDARSFRVLLLDRDVPSDLIAPVVDPNSSLGGRYVVKLNKYNEAIVSMVYDEAPFDMLTTGKIITEPGSLYYKPAIGGDSGSPVFAVYKNELIYLTNLTLSNFSNREYGPSVQVHYQEIIQAIKSLGGGYENLRPTLFSL